ncbi:hypothetical protein ACJZ2D_001871 [Fusarium nematophilum]
MERASIDGRRRTRSSTPSAKPSSKPSRKVESPATLRPASPPKSNPWTSAAKQTKKPVADMFPPLPKVQSPPSTATITAPGTSRASSISSCEPCSRDEASAAVLTAASASPSSHTSTTSRHILEAAAPRATENLWKCPFGADIVVHAGAMVFQVHRNIVEPESGWFRDNLPPPNLDGSPVEVHMVCAPEAVAHCLRFIYTRRIEICEYNREQPWNVTHLARCVLAYCAAVYLRAARMASRLLQIVENTSAELGTLVRTEYLHRVLDCAEWVQFSWHYQNAVDILFHETPQKLMRPMKLAMVSIIDAVLFWLIRQPLFLSVIQTTWHGILQTIVVNIAEFRQESRDANPYANSPLPTEAALRNLFAEADGETGGHGKARVGASSNEALVAPEGWATWEEKHRSRRGSM